MFKGAIICEAVCLAGSLLWVIWIVSKLLPPNIKCDIANIEKKSLNTSPALRRKRFRQALLPWNIISQMELFILSINILGGIS